MGAPIGVVISLIITIAFSLATGHGEYFPAPHELIDLCGNAMTAVIVQMLCSLFIGAVGGGSSVIWEIEGWSLLKQTLVHLAVISVPFFAVGYVMNWMPHHVVGALCYAAGFIATYVIMWFSMYFAIKSKLKKMNKQLQEMSRE